MKNRVLPSYTESFSLEKANDLNTGLAGSLRVENVPTLLKARPDYIGFRTALCTNQTRTSHLDIEAIKQTRNSIPIPHELRQELA